MAFRMEETTPCGAMFDAFKRHCGISHKQLAGLILSDRPLSDGRSAASRASDRTWLSHFVVHAPVGVAAACVFLRLGYGGATRFGAVALVWRAQHDLRADHRLREQDVI